MEEGLTAILCILALAAQSGQDWIGFNMIDGFPVSFTDNATGIEAGSYWIVLSDPVCDSIFVRTHSGAADSTLVIAPACQNSYGISVGSFGTQVGFILNDTSSTATTYLWRLPEPYTTWNFCPNPAGGTGRGLDYDATHGNYWQASVDGGNYLWRHLGDGTVGFQYVITQLSGDITGVTAFPYDGDTGLLVCGSTDDSFHVFKVVLGVMIHIGSGTIPDIDADYSCSLSYNVTHDTFWWLYRKGGLTYVMQFEAIIEQELSMNTWAGIKASIQSDEMSSSCQSQIIHPTSWDSSFKSPQESR